jgi:uncharacterized protein YacL
MPCLEIRILDDDVPGVSAVDQKLVELARRMGAQIVTNDFNLNKVARVQNISVLNVNELANALKLAVLPGEPMRVLILREGKEPTQGVAFLDDGTMVVVDGAPPHQLHRGHRGHLGPSDPECACCSRACPFSSSVLTTHLPWFLLCLWITYSSC